MENMNVVATNGFRNNIHPKVFTLVIACVSIAMMFAAFTSAYVVRQAAGNWLEFPLPTAFYISTGVLLLRSLVLQGSYRGFLAGKENQYKSLLIGASILGVSFVALQVVGWNELQTLGIYLNGNPSGSFMYVLSGVHAAHVIAGIGVLATALLHAFVLDFKPTYARKIRFQQTLIYWHFVDLLWIYLLLFFIFQQS